MGTESTEVGKANTGRGATRLFRAAVLVRLARNFWTQIVAVFKNAWATGVAHPRILGVGVLVVIILGVTVRDVLHNRVIVEAPSMPDVAVRSGWNGDVLARNLRAAILEIHNTAFTFHETEEYGFGSDIADIQLPGKTISIDSLVTFFRSILGLPAKRISAEVLIIDSSLDRALCSDKPPVSSEVRYQLRGRITPDGLPWLVCGTTLNQIVHKAAEHIVLEMNPYVFASYLNTTGQYERAQVVIEHILRRGFQKERPWALNLQGNMFANQGKFSEAIADYKEAMDSDPKFFIPLANWGVALAAMGRYEEAIEKFNEAIHKGSPIPGGGRFAYPLAYLGLAQTLAALTRTDEAAAFFETATSICTEILQDGGYSQTLEACAGAFHEFARLLMSEKKPDQAESELSEAITRYELATLLAPNSLDMHLKWALALTDLAVLRRDEGNLNEARDKYEAALGKCDEAAQIYSSYEPTFRIKAEIYKSLAYLENVLGNKAKASDMEQAASEMTQAADEMTAKVEEFNLAPASKSSGF